MKKTTLMLTLSLFTFCLCQVPAGATPVAPGHPRIFFRTSAWLSGPALSEVAARVERSPCDRWYERLNDEGFHTAALSWLIRSQRGEAPGADAAADSAIAGMLGLPLRDGNFYNGENLHHMSMAYDWLYHYPGFTVDKRGKVREKMLAMVEKIISHAVEGQELAYGEEIFHNYCSNAALAIGLAGLALCEGPEDKQANRLIRIAEQWYFERAFPAMALLGGGWHEGMAYGLNHVIQETPIWVAAYRSATGIDWFARIRSEQGDWMQGWIYYCLANLRPDYTFVRSCDNGASRMVPDRTLRQALELIVSAYRNPHGRFLLDELEGRLAERSISSGDLWMPLIFYDTTIEPRDYRELCPTQFIDPERLGFVAMRSGWGPDDTFVHFECGDFFGSHDHLDQNQFTIYHKGSLAIDSGYYDGYSAHHQMYAIRAIAHNTVLVRDPLEIIHSRYLDDYPSPGGQRCLDYYFNNSNYELSVYWDQYRDKSYADMGDIVALESSPAYDYVAGDATAAYNGTVATDPGARPKISRFVRRLLFVKPDIVAVCDNVDALDPSFEKRWLLHTIEEPVIAEGGMVTVSDKEGRLKLTPLLPADVKVEKVGGPGAEFMVNGVNRPLEKAPYLNPVAENGAWRLELKPGAPRKAEIFLNLIEVGDRGAPARYSFRRVEAGPLVGAVSDSLAVLFTAEREPGAPLADELALPAGTAGVPRIIVAGLEKDGVYRLCAGEKVLKAYAAGPGGVLELRPGEASSGGLALVRVHGGGR
ncbi:MAG: heparinase II/III family protein [Candidatus Glassbacteria bacterium]|nr:heparinase II/III family protein [Candidatus Glassbacteria bacterium]